MKQQNGNYSVNFDESFVYRTFKKYELVYGTQEEEEPLRTYIN
jgi:hypothetical protein